MGDNCDNCDGKCGKKDNKEEVFDAPNIIGFVKKVLFSYNAIYSASYQQNDSPIRATPDIYLIALKSMEGKNLADWRGQMETEYSSEELGPHNYLKGRIGYKGSIKFSDGETIEMEIDYSTMLMPFWVEQFLNVLSSSGVDLPRVNYNDIKGLRGKVDVKNNLKSLEPPMMDLSYSSETTVKFGEEEVVLKRHKASENAFLVRRNGTEKELKDDDLADMESTLFKSYVSQSNTGTGKPRIKVNGSQVDITEYIDGMLAAGLSDDLYRDVRIVKERYWSAKKMTDDMDSKITELRYKLDYTKSNSPSSKESIKRLDSALLAKEKEQEQYVALLMSYGGILVSADSMKSSLRRSGLKNTFAAYDAGMKELLKEDFIEGIRQDMAKYKKGMSLFQVGGG